MNPFRQLYKAVLVLVFAVICNTGAFAQDSSFYIDDASVVPGETFILDVKTTGFDSILGASFTLNWDALDLEFVEVSNIALGLTLENSFNIMNAADGVASYLFLDGAVSSGKTLPDNSTLFSVEFIAIGTPNQDTEVQFVGTPTAIEMINANEVELAVITSASTVSITEMVNTTELIEEGFVINEIYPNPFTETAQIEFSLEDATELVWVLSTIEGKELKRGKDRFSAGLHALTIHKNDLNQSGQYFVSFYIGNGKLTRKLIFIE